MTLPHPKKKKLDKEKGLALIQPAGLLSNALKGFECRPQQQQMMGNVIDAYNEGQIALIEAGTGTGKSLAYLVPAIMWAAHYRERTVISTHTIALQEQLIKKDLPDLIKALNLSLSTALVKGMNNYLCVRKLEDAQAEMRLFPADEGEEIERIAIWKQTTTDGSRADLPFTPSAKAWEHVGAESDACSGQRCPHHQQCYFFKARERANDAQILVVNHHLLFSDLVMRMDATTPSILPPYDRVVLDEAHHVEDIATEHFAARLHCLEILKTLGRLSSEKQNKEHGKLAVLQENIQASSDKSSTREISALMSRLVIDLPALKRQIHDQLLDTFDLYTRFADQLSRQDQASPVESKWRILQEHQTHPRWKEEVIPQTQKLTTTLKQYIQGLMGMESALKIIDNEKLQDKTKSVRLDIQALASRLSTSVERFEHFTSPMKDANKVRWIEAQKLKSLTNTHLVDADLDVSTALVNFLFTKIPTIVLCSATMTTNQRFSFMRERLGLTKDKLPDRRITENIYDSPFDYSKQAMLLIPTDMPDPSHGSFQSAAQERIWDAIEASRGNAFVLFTSYSMLRSCYDALAAKLERHGFVPMKQGDANRHALLSRFKETDRSVLFGTDSFWEGIDVAGDALRCVILVKLPFKVPSEPMIQARTEALIAQGKNPFLEYSVPHAIVKFKQGFGRLIRNKWDRGCIVCLDTRLINKSYGQLFLNSLPACAQVFGNSQTIKKQMVEFYRKTTHFVQNNPFTAR